MGAPTVKGPSSGSTTTTPAAPTSLGTKLTDASSAAASGMVNYVSGTVNGTTQTQLIVGVQGAAANTKLSVTIGTTVVGTITTDAKGNGQLCLASNPTGNQQALPANFPTNIASGTTVSAGTLTGTLTNVLPPPRPPSGGPGGQGGQGTQTGQGTSLGAKLTDSSNTAASGMINFLSNTVNGTTQTLLIVGVLGAAANTKLSVTIGTTVVGTITTDAKGNGQLCLASNPTGNQQALPANFPTSITSGTTVSVGTLTGTLNNVPPPPPPPPAGGSGSTGTTGSGGTSGSGSSTTKK